LRDYRKEKVIYIDPENPDMSLIRRASFIVRGGGVIVFPTETLYGIGVDAGLEGALKKVFDIKKRDMDRPILVLVDDPSWIGDLVQEINPVAERLMERFWPGRLTLLFRAKPDLSPLLTGRMGKVGVRISSHPVAMGIVRETGRPVTATSANISGERGPSSPEEISSRLIDLVDLVIDSGKTPEGLPSTLVDTTSTRPVIVREGAVSRQEIEAFIGHH